MALIVQATVDIEKIFYTLVLYSESFPRWRDDQLVPRAMFLGQSKTTTNRRHCQRRQYTLGRSRKTSKDNW